MLRNTFETRKGGTTLEASAEVPPYPYGRKIWRTGDDQKKTPTHYRWSGFRCSDAQWRSGILRRIVAGYLRLSIFLMMMAPMTRATAKHPVRKYKSIGLAAVRPVVENKETDEKDNGQTSC